MDGVLKEMLEGQRDTVLDIVSGLRGLIRGLRPAGLDEFGLSVTLENYVASLGDGRGTKPVISSDVETDGLDLPPMVSLCLFRAAQEALRNALRHAQADTVMLRLCVQAGEPGALELAVQDDGRGFTCARAAGGVRPKESLRPYRRRGAGDDGGRHPHRVVKAQRGHHRERQGAAAGVSPTGLIESGLGHPGQMGSIQRA